MELKEKLLSELRIKKEKAVSDINEIYKNKKELHRSVLSKMDLADCQGQVRVIDEIISFLEAL